MNYATTTNDAPTTTLDAPEAFPARLAKLIGSMSVRAFARKAGVSDTFLRQCLAGRTEPTRTKLIAIADAGDTTVEWLATGGATGHASVESGAQGLDQKRLETIIARTEEELTAMGRPLAAGTKGRIVARLYATHVHSPQVAPSRELIRQAIVDNAPSG